MQFNPIPIPITNPIPIPNKIQNLLSLVSSFNLKPNPNPIH